MTNTTEFFQPEYSHLALPAATLAVFLDDVPCEDLEPVEIIRSGWPEFGWASLVYNPTAGHNAQAVNSEAVEDKFGMGRHIGLRTIYNAAPEDVTLQSIPVFTGHIDEIQTTIDSKSPAVRIIARDFSMALRRVTIYGQHVLGDDGSSRFMSGLETHFNPSGQGNASTESVRISGTPCTPFSARTADARPWSCAQVIAYLLTVHLPNASLHRPDIDRLSTLTEYRLAHDLDVTGLTLLEALHRCCESAGVQFRFVPRLVESGPRQAIVFYRNGSGRTVELNLQPNGGQLSVSRTNIAELHGTRNFYPVTHRYMGQGDFRVYEATFELVKAWDPALEGTIHTKFCASTNPQFHEVRDVYRKWCLNEAGDYTPAPYNQGEPFDFSPIFEQGSFIRRRRRFWPALSADTQGRSLGYFLEVSLDNGLNWHEYLYAFNNLLDECGLWLSSDQLDVDTWVAALKGYLRFRITASVVSDERLTCTVADGPVGSTIPVVDHVTTLPRRFRYRKVSAYSLLASEAPGQLGTPDETDDADALYEYVRNQAAASSHIIETLDVRTPTLLLHLDSGDRATSGPDSRDVLGTRRDNRSVAWIDRVHVNLRQQYTQLKLIRRRK